MKNFIVFFIIFPFVLNAQNLVKNPSFENHSICPTESEQFNGYVDDWNTYFSTPDYLNQCGYYPWWTGNATPRTGDAVVNALWFNLATHKQREYLHGDLVHPLSAGKTYYLEFYVYTRVPGVAIAQIQAHFTEEIIDTVPANWILEIPAHIENQNGVITQQEWVKVSGCYEAVGGEKIVILGNFASNEDTDTIHLSSSLTLANKTLVDDVGLFEISTLVPSDDTIMEQTKLDLIHEVDLEYYLNDSLLNFENYIFQDTGVFTIDVYLDECGYIGSFEVTVTGCDEVLLFTQLNQDTTICLDEEIRLFNTPTFPVEYFLDGTSLFNEYYQFSDTGVYYFIATMTECDLIDSLIINVENCSPPPDSMENHCIYIPNAFSPNKDGNNDEFEIFTNCEVVSFNLQVFNRWGDKIFQSKSIENNWKGQYLNNERVPIGVYVYLLKIDLIIDGQLTEKLLSGDITLLR